jgi:ABC-type glycerol-3-phosphate transport system substrate-binding protein
MGFLGLDRDSNDLYHPGNDSNIRGLMKNNDGEKETETSNLIENMAKSISRRRFLAVSGVAALSAVAVACGSSESSDTTVAAPSTDAPVAEEEIGGEITLWAWGAGLEGDKTKERIAYFNSKYPNVKVNWEPLAKNGYEEYPALLARFASGNAPDVMRVLNFQPTQLVAEGDALLALDDFIAADPDIDMADFLAPTVLGGQVNGKQYGMPDNTEPYVIYYNKDAFAAAGLEDPQVLFGQGKWDQASFESSINALMSKGGMKFGLAFEAWNYDTFCFMGGGTVLDSDQKPTIDQGASPQMLDFFAKLVKDGKSPSPVVGGGAQLEAFRNGEVGMYLMGPWWYGALAGTTKFKYDVTGLPSFNGVRAGKLELGSLAISSASKNPKAAWAYVKTVTDTEGLKIWSAVATPTRRSALQAAGFNDEQWKKDAVAMVEAGTFTPFTTKGSAVDAAVSAALDNLWAGKSTAAAATADAVKRLTEALGS